MLIGHGHGDFCHIDSAALELLLVLAECLRAVVGSALNESAVEEVLGLADLIVSLLVLEFCYSIASTNSVGFEFKEDFDLRVEPDEVT